MYFTDLSPNNDVSDDDNDVTDKSARTANTANLDPKKGWQ
jgi:hypothetical protein